MGSGGVRRRRWIARNHVFGAPGLFGTAGFAGFRRTFIDRRPSLPPAGLPTERKKDLLIVFTPPPYDAPHFRLCELICAKARPRMTTVARARGPRCAYGPI